MEPILAALEVESFGKPVRVEFTKIDGVISHTILLVNDGDKVPILKSRINAPGQPCFTELHQQDDLLFFTGADGSCHWSMSVELAKASMPKQPESLTQDILDTLNKRFGPNAPGTLSSVPGMTYLAFDIACRTKDAAAATSIYEPAGPQEWDLKVSDPIAFVFCNSKSARTALALGSDAYRSQLFPSKQTCLVQSGDANHLSITAIGEAPTIFPATYQWRYAVWRMM